MQRIRPPSPLSKTKYETEPHRVRIVKQINSAAHESPGPGFKTWHAFKVPSTQSYWCENGESPLVLHLSAPPFDTLASASLQTTSVDRSTSGPVAIHKSLWERCALPHMSARWDTVENPSVYYMKKKKSSTLDQQYAFLCPFYEVLDAAYEVGSSG